MIVLTKDQVAKLIFRDQFRSARLRPMRLADGRYAVNENVLNDPRHARWHSILRQGTIEDAAALTYASDSGDDGFVFTVDGKLGTVGWASNCNPTRAFPFPQRGTFDIVADNTYRFEPQYNNDHLSFDWHSNRRRVELGFRDISAANGTEWWSSWSTVLTDTREALLGLPGQSCPPNATLIHQWFNGTATSGKSGPFFWIAFDRRTSDGVGCLWVCSRNSGSQSIAGQTNHYIEPFAVPSGVPTHFVVHGRFGSAGHLTVWMNGVAIVDTDCPLGFHAYPAAEQIAHVSTGVYQANVTEKAVVYHCNIEWGPRNLLARVGTPLPVNAPTDGW